MIWLGSSQNDQKNKSKNNSLTWLMISAVWLASDKLSLYPLYHGLRTPNEGINQRYLKNWANVEDKICFGRT